MIGMGQYYDTYVVIHNAAILTLQIQCIAAYQSLQCFAQCVHERFENIFVKIM